MKTTFFFNLFLGTLVGFQNPYIISDNNSIEPIIALAFHPRNPISFTSAKETEFLTSGQKQTVNSRRNCSISAYVNDPDPQGLNVRNAPNSSARILKKLPTNTPAVFVEVTASQGQWVEINKAESDTGATIFQGKGWVFASLLGTSTRGYGTSGVTVYASPNTRSRVVDRIPPEKEVSLLSCSGSWAYVSYQQIKGWIAKVDQCPNPLTTCP